MKIIYYDESYLEACTTFLLNYYNQPAFNANFTEITATTYTKEFTYGPRFIGFLLMDKKQLKGLCFAHIKTWGKNEHLQIEEFLVDPNDEDNQLAHKLMDFLELYATNYNLKGITLATNLLPLIDFCTGRDFLNHEISFLHKGLPGD